MKNTASSLPSISRRLLLASVIVLPLFLLLTGWLLNGAMKRSLLLSQQAQLQANTYQILSAAEWDNGELWMPEVLPEARFQQIDSGLYGIISSENQLLWRSESSSMLATNTLLPELAPFAINQRQFLHRDNRFIFSFDVSWQLDENVRPLRIILFQSDHGFVAELAVFQGELWRWLTSMALFLTLAQYAVLRWGLSPLTRLAREVRALQQGKIANLSHNYPKEIQPVATNVNTLIANQQQQQQRFQHALADLAHSLKTPLAIIHGELSQQASSSASSMDKNQALEQQLQRMDQIIQHQLQRANRGTHSLSAQRIVLKPVIERITQALTKLYYQRGIEVVIDVDEQSFFHGREDDLMEVLGNIIDNAFKYTRSKVLVRVKSSPYKVSIEVIDDGKGIDTAYIEHIVQRGVRIDTLQPGQGIGLAVVQDIMLSYQGEFAIKANTDHGTCAQLIFNLPHSDEPINY